MSIATIVVYTIVVYTNVAIDIDMCLRMSLYQCIHQCRYRHQCRNLAIDIRIHNESRYRHWHVFTNVASDCHEYRTYHEKERKRETEREREREREVEREWHVYTNVASDCHEHRTYHANESGMPHTCKSYHTNESESVMPLKCEYITDTHQNQSCRTNVSHITQPNQWNGAGIHAAVLNVMAQSLMPQSFMMSVCDMTHTHQHDSWVWYDSYTREII